MDKDKVIELFAEWNRAIQTGDAAEVAELYDKDEGILLPTMSNRVRHNREEIADYFKSFLANKPVGELLESNVRIYDDLAVNSGLYKFTFQDNSSVHARFTFVYKSIDSRWLIIEHHSSLMPERENNR